MADGEFRTDDLALAVTLSLAGIPHRVIAITSFKVIWEFVPKDSDTEEMDELIDQYEDWDAKVCPRRFIIKLREVRQEMDKALKAAARDQLRPVSPPA